MCYQQVHDIQTNVSVSEFI